ncbi:MAG: nitronate monooxygenase, partial [Lentisphaeria bacterium]|nr:nitronate monooxygenase [Lentisphaeria bacterium]
VHPAFKDVFKRAKARDAISTPQYDSKLPVVAVRALRNKGTDEFGKLQLRLLKELEAGTIHRQEAQEEVEKFWVGALRRAAVDGDVENGSLMAGQSVGLVDEIMSVRDVIEELLTDAEDTLGVIKGRFN